MYPLDIPMRRSSVRYLYLTWIRCSQLVIVVPLSIISNWEKQIDDHCQPGSLTSCVYYGKGRELSASELMRYDVVITTYQTVVQDHELALPGKSGARSAKKLKTDKGLFDVMWKVRRTSGDVPK